MLIFQTNILIEMQYYIHVCMIIQLYKECCCKYKILNFIIDADGKLLKSIIKVI